MNYTNTIPVRQGVIELVSQHFEKNNKIPYCYETESGLREINLSKDYVIYLIYYLVKLTKEEGFGILLNTELLRKNFIDDYKPYLHFLEHIDILLETNDPYVPGVRSKFYGIRPKYYSLSKIYTRYRITNKHLLKKINVNTTGLSKYDLERNLECLKRRKHLIKHFDKHLSMDIDLAYKEIANLYSKKYDANSRLIHEYESKLWRYSIKEETDDRLHSILTRTNKKLLKYITYKGKKLAEVDFKTCQPLFLYITLKTIFEGSMDSLVCKFLTKKLGLELIEKIRNHGIDTNELNNFGSIIFDKDLYIYLVEKLKPKKNKIGKYGYYSHKEDKYIGFEKKRELMKNMVMRSLYGGHGKYITDFKKEFSSIFKIVDIINKHPSLSESKSNLSNVLQNVEAYVILDLIAKDVSKEFKNIPLFSKHDSIITYSNSIDEVAKYTRERFIFYTGISGEKVLKTEHWE